MRATIVVVAGVIERKGRILAAKRKRGAHLEGHWEFPGGKLEPDESPEECLVRELEEELGVVVRPSSVLDVSFHRYPERSVLLLFYACEILRGEPSAVDCEEVLWVPREALPSLAWAPADVDFVEKLSRSGSP